MLAEWNGRATVRALADVPNRRVLADGGSRMSIGGFQVPRRPRVDFRLRSTPCEF